MYKDDKLYVAHSANGYIFRVRWQTGTTIAGATGTEKRSLQVLAETFSQAGVPCFMADMKGLWVSIGG